MLDSFLTFTENGIGMFLNGQLYLGSQHPAGSTGFLKATRNDKVNIDGRTGTWKTVRRLLHICHKIEDVLKGPNHSILRDILGDKVKNISLSPIIEATKKFDPICCNYLRNAFAENCGVGLFFQS
ncbi:MAG: hypothetical protein GY750_03735 [Lentisphaerae bacterium]|nr:hypothetical protein [Lentisphaerota bacterium]MCP4100525.1 hypothetical protein [Lentisphaerota bacterium]